jgi:YbbR domain-containing protein
MARLLFSDWPASASLSIALLLTLFFNLTRLEQRTINIPLTVSINDVLAPSSQYPSMVKVILRGERDMIYSIREDKISASLDLSEYKNEGVYRVPIRLQKRGNALVADPLEIHPEPSDIAIGLEKRIAKSVPVTPSFKGFLESGFELANFDILPPEVTISGPAGLVSRASEISTDTIELSGKSGLYRQRASVEKRFPFGVRGKDSVFFPPPSQVEGY